MARMIQGELTLVRSLRKQLAAGRVGNSLSGDKELTRKLSELGKQSTVNKMVRPGVREAASQVSKIAKSLVIEETGLLRKSIGSKTLTVSGKVVVAIVGPRRGMGQKVQRTRENGERYTQFADPALYAHLVEFGTSHHRPYPFMRPAWDRVDSKRIIARRTMSELRKLAQNRTGKVTVNKAAVAGLRRAA